MSVFFPDDPTKPEIVKSPNQTRNELVVSHGMASLVMVVFLQPRPVDWIFDGFQELDSIVPSHVLQTVSEEIDGQYVRREIETRPTVAEIREMALAAMAMRREVVTVLAKKPSRFYPPKPQRGKKTTTANRFRRLRAPPAN